MGLGAQAQPIHEGTFDIQGMDLLGRKVGGDGGRTLLRLANAPLYLDAFGHVVIGWNWLRQALAAADALARNNFTDTDWSFYEGKLAICRYFSRYDLPHAMNRLALCRSLESTCLDASIEMFGA